MAKQWNVFIAALLMLLPIQAQASTLSSDYAAKPPLLNESSEPLVMLVMSVDHELFKKAYPDYSDLDGDGELDTTYNNSFEYLGYFESDWCYSYNNSGYYEPQKKASGVNAHYCDPIDLHWSGNFLNWATMSRIDILRRVLFGGKRYLDIATDTILERANLLIDIHAFVKTYSGSDLERLSPYNLIDYPNGISLCNSTPSENSAPVVRVARDEWKRWAFD